METGGAEVDDAGVVDVGLWAGVGVRVGGIVEVSVGVCCVGDVRVTAGADTCPVDGGFAAGVVAGGFDAGLDACGQDEASLGGPFGCDALVVPVPPFWGALWLPGVDKDGFPSALGFPSCST